MDFRNGKKLAWFTKTIQLYGYKSIQLYGLQMNSSAKIDYLYMMLSRVSAQAMTPDDCAA